MTRTKNLFLQFNSFLNRHSNIFGFIFLTISLSFLVASSLYVSSKSGLIHANNHDNIIANYLFESRDTFQDALFPAAHSFLLKWPIFALSAYLGNSLEVYVYGTIVLYTTTVLGFMLVIFLLSRKNLYITSTIGIILSLVLLMVPPQPIDGALLPLNMAMITTRNIEFLLLFAFIYLAINVRKILSMRFLAATLILSILGASDKFYLLTTIVAALLYIGYQNSQLNKITNRDRHKSHYPLAASLVSYVLANLLLLIINKLDITNIPNSSSAAPFSIVGSVWQMLEALAGGIQVTIANFGANIFGKSLSASLIPYLLNGLVLIASLYCCYLVFRRFNGTQQKATEYRFALMLIFLFISSLIVFISSEHNYIVGGRYLTISIFAGFSGIAMALTAYKHKYKNSILVLLSLGLLIISPIYAYAAHKNYARAFSATHNAIGERTEKVADIIKDHDADLFVGDYWFVLPVRLKTDNTVVPVLMSTEKCNTPNNFLTSYEWYEPSSEEIISAISIQKDPDPNTETFNHGCTLQYLNNHYGKPVKEYLIRGTKENPIEAVRIYDYDVREKF